MIYRKDRKNKTAPTQDDLSPADLELKRALDECSIIHTPNNIIECISNLRNIQNTTDILFTADPVSRSLQIDMTLLEVDTGPDCDEDSDANVIVHDGEPDYFIDIDNAYRLNLEYLSGVTARHLHDLVHTPPVVSEPLANKSNEEFLMRLLHNYEQHIEASKTNPDIRRLCPIE